MKEIGLFGGTFDPPHIGHMIMAQEVLNQCHLDEIWFVPVHTPPHKKRESQTSNEDRLKMLEACVSDVENFFISTVEYERKGISYTFDTVKHLRSQFPDVKFYFIIGGDMIEQLSNWHQIEELKDMITFIGVHRPGSDVVKSENILQIKTIQIDVSSSLIRKRIKEGKPIKYLVPEQVERMIRKRGLYGEGAST
ncbi:nicotinate-nucleotide adenylyltransferase [Alkalihalobacillus trypoxylicola]|uniref:Probable nicotinate-nucleotide adenylyltransferase n=1 Tax=Alkalihalobacillus trypoxylicola TaxID=519424 RepID=A0A162E7Z9_9BACI|nr:nicotinate-nucleotide adenylyltransferase [Alkalihalobacillus trypoxylicola]KYG32000.1 nicotinic acid mononucleotide adenylyltransferase [Alkalihalobacillus trypoxylicola]GAF65993.1 nicotinate-nucleotide adenylyltransferase [Bacillus sp. TS-2]